ncbi:Smr/MutS family protein [Wohlfahrtiimonas larvae]|uniref:Smr/MutS family protein n=1 Tax=Wohlfahrtiimonas larvae TaxID=1157986 RepID=A0ABP9MLV8_9GAMM|nr:Smr/MutS family protein [Wohlfahrtiimonas larvae]
MTKNYIDELKTVKKILRRESVKKTQTIMHQKKTECVDLSFSELMKDVRRLKSDVVEHPSKPLAIRINPHFEETEYEYFYVGDCFKEMPKQYSKNGRGNRDLQKLLQRHYRIVSELDLHGEKVDGLDELLSEFCHFIQEHGVCGRIIHGSGLGSKNSTPILKNKVRFWLYEHPEVLAYTEENNNDGAVLILLKNKKYF